MAYTYKVWIVDGKEHFEYGNGQTRKKDFPFAESLMKLLYLDIWSFADLFEGMGKSIVKLYETKEQQYSDNVLSALNTVAKKHIYFELLRLDWWERLEKAKAQGYKDIVVLLPRKKLPHTPANIHTMQKQMKALFAQVLDLDLSPKESVQQKMVQYYNNRGGDQLNTFQFQPQAMSFEIIGPKTFTEVLYPKDIYDIIDYFVREFVKRKQPIRLCKNCGRYFAVSGRINTEYCDRPTDDKGRTCKDMGATNVWGQKSGKMMRCSRSTAENTKNALAGLRREKSRSMLSMLGVKKPEKKKRSVMPEGVACRNLPSG